MNKQAIVKLNQKGWNQALKVHRAHQPEYEKLFLDKNHIEIDELLKKALQENNLLSGNSSIIQLGCNNGREIISIERLGGKNCVGVDFSSEALEDARKISDSAKSNCTFVLADINEADKVINKKFDAVVFTVGVLGFLPSLDKIFNTCKKLLKNKGVLIIYDMHPFMELLADKSRKEFDAKNPLIIVYNYFKKTFRKTNEGIDYWGQNKYESEPLYIKTIRLENIFNSLIKNSFSIRRFSEYQKDTTLLWKHLENADPGLPKSYILIAEKK